MTRLISLVIGFALSFLLTRYVFSPSMAYWSAATDARSCAVSAQAWPWPAVEGPNVALCEELMR